MLEFMEYVSLQFNRGGSRMSWQLGLSHSHIQFTVRHMMASKVRGRFETFTATIEANEQNPANSTIAVQIDAASIDSKDPKRDEHLKSPDFLDVEHYPYITFKSSRLALSDETNGQLYGDLTIRGVTKEVILDAVLSQYRDQPPRPCGGRRMYTRGDYAAGEHLAGRPGARR
jgi:polyisoprenoid-binding protein YceI